MWWVFYEVSVPVASVPDNSAFDPDKAGVLQLPSLCHDVNNN